MKIIKKKLTLLFIKSLNSRSRLFDNKFCDSGVYFGNFCIFHLYCFLIVIVIQLGHELRVRQAY